MYCKIKMTCKICKCSTEFQALGFHPQKQIVCQSCGQLLPSDIYDTLVTAMHAMASIDKDTCRFGTGEEMARGFLFSVSGEPEPTSYDQQFDLD